MMPSRPLVSHDGLADSLNYWSSTGNIQTSVSRFCRGDRERHLTQAILSQASAMGTVNCVSPHGKRTYVPCVDW